MNTPIIKVIIPAVDEEKSIAKVIAEIPKHISEVIVVNNGSVDSTALVAKKSGATVLEEPKKGYGNACLKGLSYLKGLKMKPDIVVFLDGDYSDYPAEMTKIVAPIINNEVDFVVGSRSSELREKGAMTFPQRFGNWLATFLMKLLFDATFSDLGPFRAIKYETLESLNMQDKTYGWTVEMQLKVLKKNIRYTEVPVHYKKRIGVSKVSGTIKGAIFAGFKILSWIFKYSL